MRITLQKKLIIISSVSVFIPLMIFATLFYILGGRLLITDFKSKSIENLYLVDQAITLYIEKIKHTVNTIVNTPIVQNLDTNEIVTYKDFDDWTEMVPYKNSETERRVYEYLKLIHLNNPDLGAVYIGTDSGKFVMYPPSHRRPHYNPSERPWYKEVEKMEGQITITSPFKSSDKNYNIFAVARQMHFHKSNETGIVSANIELDTITNIIEQLNIGKTGFVILAKKDNTILANPADPSINFKKLTSSDIDQSYNLLTELGNNWSEIKINQKNYLAKKYYSIGTDWLLYFLITKSEVLSPMKKMLIIMIILSMSVILLFTPLSIKFSLASIKPLKKLNKHLLNLYSGNVELNKRIPIYANDEIGETIENFNLFSEKLNKLFIDMKKTNNLISSNISEFSSEMLIASADIEKTKTAVANTSIILGKIENIISDLENISGTKKSRELKEGTGELRELFSQLSIYIGDIENASGDINNSLETSIGYCRKNKKILSDISKNISVYKTIGTADK